MFRSIMVPLDGSRLAEAALPLAKLVAERSEASVELVMVHQSAIPGGIPEGFSSMAESQRRAERDYLAGVGKRFLSGVTDVATSFLEGRPAEALTAHAMARGPDLVVMTTHGRGALNRIWLGSVTDELIRTLPMPMVLFRPAPNGPPPGPAPAPRRIAVALDRSGFGEAALIPATAFAELFGAELLLVHIVHPPVPMAEPPMPYLLGFDGELSNELTQQAEAYLGAVAGRLRTEGHRVLPHVAAGGDTATAILGQAAEAEADMIAIATHGETGVRRLLLGSVADKVVRGSNVPVLVTRPRPKADGPGP